MRKCVFFDRDGIVNKEPTARYVRSWEEFHLNKEFPEILKMVTEQGYSAAIITNQRGVATGVMTQEDLDTIHRNLLEMLDKQYGLSILGIYSCTHGKDEPCECRKPKPGMILQAARDHDLDLKNSWMIGDQERDIEAGQAAGCRTILLRKSNEPTAADHHLPDLHALKSIIAECF